ncbi:MAG: anthranilate synthase component I family protein [Flavobacterium sp.]|uniref:anthranilate synthase component I family protein n=1 Tax=Flavobacterium sp. TaxID=239 RepID=UPI00122A7747|nr:anthranilate synthase component I family protein [Flavobacterium sp.]RZJ65838.1 MAG: anthranilate synthase component I family protein [Flavobacterium sp.]
MRTVLHKKIHDPQAFKQQLVHWSQSFREKAFLDSNNYGTKYHTYDCVLAAEAFISLKTDYHEAFDDLRQLHETTRDWLFGYLSYDLKNDTEKLTSQNFDGLHFSDMYFFQPKKLFLLKGNELEIAYLHLCDDEMEDDFKAILNTRTNLSHEESRLRIRQRISQKDYLKKVERMQQYIHRGDIYEANFCMEFYAEDAQINPLETYCRLNAISEPPFSAYFRNGNDYLMCASPERYLKKQHHKIISQPIKGTAKRSDDKVEDGRIKARLAANQKERSENIMIVDLVRNDLSKTAAKGSVHVEELCGEYTFRQVHHLISTVVSELGQNQTAVKVLKTTFPMGSMTGAPKISAMKIIEELEETKRGLYSGALGYFTPEGDFDFNVVIRSILYNSESKYVSFSVGSAITALSNPLLEYEECLVKAVAMRRVLERE